ncbi:hypothetical protein OG21DRAFT_1488168 [Imleria badia]|nr:hypothetical protein OG21DRAFT_1488168 [Imleria badia]
MPDFDVAALSSVTGAQLKFWVDQANTAAGRKALTKSGRVDDLRQRLAAHYHLDLMAAAPAVAPTTPSPSTTLAIQNCQWNALCDLGDEWDECTRMSKPFLLCALSPAMSELVGWSPSAHIVIATPGTTLTMTPQAATGTSALPLLALPTQTHGPSEDHAILQACQLELDALSRASSLHEVVEQVEEGWVQQIRDKYGPRKGRPPNLLWENIKSTVNWQEQLYAQLEREFAGERERFFNFFTHQPRNELASSSSKGKHKASGESLFPLRKVVEAIPRRDRDLAGERLRDVYRDNAGDFSEVKWHEHWGSMNSWEVWRAMGMEKID